MSEERASVLERMTSAMGGGGDSEIVAALGMAQIAAGRLPGGVSRALAGIVGQGAGAECLVASIGVGLTRLQASATQLTFDQARAGIISLVTRLNESRRWRLTDSAIVRVAEGSLLMHLHPTCTACHGRGHVPGTPTEACASCGGTGQRPYPRRNADEVKSTLHVLGLIQGLTERAVARRIS